MIENPVFLQSVIFVLKYEGGYVNDPDGPGGETKYGISKKSYPDLNIADVTIDLARRIYKQDYWDKLRCEEMPSSVAMVLLDSGVNCGTKRVAMWVQESLRSMGYKLKTDGIIGPKTLSAIHDCDDKALILVFLARRLFRYICLAKKYPQYVRGWVGRVSDLMKEVAWMSRNG
jgi:lysozyme family protein